MIRCCVMLLLALGLPGLLGAAPSTRPSASVLTTLPGLKADGSVLLPNQWSLRPAGKQVRLGDFPVNLAVHPSGRFVVALHAGYGEHELVCVSVPGGRLIARVGLPQAFYGLAFSSDGSRIYCSGAADEVIHEFQFRNGYFTEPRTLALHDATSRGVPGGLALSTDGRRLFAADVFGQDVALVDVTAGRADAFVALGGPSVAVDLSRTQVSTNADLAAVEKRPAALRDALPGDAPYPYGVALDEAHDRLYVSLWAGAAVAVIDLKSHAVAGRWSVEEHPNELLLTRSGERLFVANANLNTVSVLDTATGRPVEVLSAAMTADARPGSTPNSLALSPDERFLFVANAGNNNVAVFDLEKPGRSRSLGFIPVGWYPTSVRVTPDGRYLLVANGKGATSRSNRHGPQPNQSAPDSVREYMGGLLQGTLSMIKLPAAAQMAEEIAEYSEKAIRCSPVPATAEGSTKRARENPVPASVGGRSPIRYVLYVIKENRTYDQVLGDVREGNGDPSLCLFPEEVTPNQHRLAREFVLLDNFYVDGEVSADGHEWSLGAYATDYVEKTWPLNYGHGASGKVPYPSEGKFPIARPASGYLWDRAREAGVSYRSYAEFIDAAATPDQPATTRVPSLKDHFDPWFRPWDMNYPDVQRTERFIAELKRFEREGDMPRLQILRLPNDHTYGSASGKRSPRAMVADNDLALGRLVEAVSHSKFWPRTAIFVLEDDAQNGPDHVDAHRSIAFIASPYAKRHFRDSTMYSTCSMLRTMELILGLKPLTQFDEAAAPMYPAFQPRPDLRPFSSQPARVSLTETNSPAAWGTAMSDQMDFTHEDAADDLALNKVIWHSVKGGGIPMPAPVRAAFVRGGGDDDD